MADDSEKTGCHVLGIDSGHLYPAVSGTVSRRVHALTESTAAYATGLLFPHLRPTESFLFLHSLLPRATKKETKDLKVRELVTGCSEEAFLVRSCMTNFPRPDLPISSSAPNLLLLFLSSPPRPPLSFESRLCASPVTHTVRGTTRKRLGETRNYLTLGTRRLRPDPHRLEHNLIGSAPTSIAR
ncbi:hypothetical protein LX36DRAFT_433584 [Colletotrichum falcatum]|nr:hypothetical protein LX36DRAFT_433584 [Colletotrichum falcatum]